MAFIICTGPYHCFIFHSQFSYCMFTLHGHLYIYITLTPLYFQSNSIVEDYGKSDILGLWYKPTNYY